MKSVEYLIYNGVTSGASLLGSWPDAPLPTFTISTDGYPDLTVTLPRDYGAMDEPLEPGTTSTLTLGNRVDVWVHDPTWQTSTRVYRGTIEAYEWAPGEGVSVTIRALSRVLDQILVPVPVEGAWVSPETTQTAVALWIAQWLVDTHAGTNPATGALVWDSTNPGWGTATRASGAADSSITYTARATTLARALEDIRAQMGHHWIWYVTPDSTVRFFQADTATPDHRLTLGVEVTDARLRKDQTHRVRRVAVRYAGDQVYVDSSASFVAADPRAIWIEAGTLAMAEAIRLAEETLYARDRIQLSGQLTVAAAAYPIESIRVGDSVQLHVPRQLGTGTGGAGYEDYNQPLAIYSIDYALDRATLHLEQPAPDLRADLKRQADALHDVRGRVAPALYGITHPTTATTVGAAGTAAAPPGTPELWEQVVRNGTTYKIALYNP